MLRLTHRKYPLRGLGGSFGIDLSLDSIAKTVVNALAPAMQNAMPGLVDAAIPQLQARLPELMTQAVEIAWPQLEAKVPGLINQAVPQITGQIPKMVNQAIPILYAKLPEIKAKLMPLVTAEADALVDSYVKRYMGPAYMFKQYAPALAIISTALTLFASGIIIYKFWADE